MSLSAFVIIPLDSVCLPPGALPTYWTLSDLVEKKQRLALLPQILLTINLSLSELDA